MSFLAKYYFDIIKDNYGIDNNDVMEMYNIIGKKIGALKNNEIDYEKVSYKVYNDVINGSIKGVTYDRRD